MSSAPVSAGVTPATAADLLVEALPYIREFHGSTMVVKWGGNTLRAGREAIGVSGDVEAGDEPPGGGWQSITGEPGEAATLATFAEDIVLLRSVGIRPVVVHGGGPQIGELMRRLGKEPRFQEGRRVTDAETLDIARMVLVGKVNREIVSAVNVHGPLAVGLSGEDARLLEATARHEDLGFVGEVEQVNPEILERILNEGLIPVVATIGADEAGQAYNINADTVAGALAAALGAEKLIVLTDVEGLRADPADATTRVPRVTSGELEVLLRSGVAADGMAPKAESCLRAVRSGVRRAHLLDGRVPHALLVELFTDSGVGTMVVP